MRFINAMKMHAASMDAGAPAARWGTVTGVDTASMTVKVMLQPEGVQTDWLPLASSMVGGGWGLVHAPATGTQVLCLPDAGDHTSYVVIGGTWSAGSLPPANVKQGEFWLVHSSGSKVALTNDGKVTISDASGSSLAFGNDGTATLTATNISLAGTVNVTNVLKVGGVTVTVP